MVAAKLFWQKGYDRTTIEDITGALGLNKAMLYYYFPDKQTLLYNVMFSGLRSLLPKAKKISGMKLPPEQKLELLVKNHVEWYVVDSAGPAIANSEIRNLSPKFRRRYIAGRDTYEAIFRKVIAGGIKERQFRRMDVKLATAFILGLLNSLSRWYRSDGKYSVEDIGSQLGSFVSAGLKQGFGATPYGQGQGLKRLAGTSS